MEIVVNVNFPTKLIQIQIDMGYPGLDSMMIVLNYLKKVNLWKYGKKNLLGLGQYQSCLLIRKYLISSVGVILNSILIGQIFGKILVNLCI